MSTAFVDDEVTSPFARAQLDLDDPFDTDLGRVHREDLLAQWRELERLRNRLAAVEHRFVAEVEARHLPAEFGAKNTAAFLRGLLRVDPYEAAGRVRAADAAASRTTSTGQPQPAPFAHVAAAQTAGLISAKHASTVVAAVERLSTGLQVEHGERVEVDLVELAGRFDPAELAKLGVRMTTLLDQDGALEESRKRDRNRDLAVHQRPDGSARVTGEATAGHQQPPAGRRRSAIARTRLSEISSATPPIPRIGKKGGRASVRTEEGPLFKPDEVEDDSSVHPYATQPRPTERHDRARGDHRHPRRSPAGLRCAVDDGHRQHRRCRHRLDRHPTHPHR